MSKHLGFHIVFGLFLLGLSGCAGMRTRPPENHAIDQMLEKDVGEIDHALAARIMSEPHSLKSKSKSREKVESEIQNRVWWWLRYYSVRDRERFARTLERGENYRPLVQQILGQHRLPAELYYLAMIESSYVNHATSPTSAVGIWQFMRPTALNYGLGVNENFDERRHPIAATEAAAKYLSDLHRKFNSWYLAIAAYNAGPGRISEAVRKGHTRDFWVLTERGLLPHETMDYIPKFLAAATIGAHLQQFGFNDVRSQTEWPEIASINLKVKRNPVLKLSDVATETALSERDLLRFNPQLKQVLSHPHKSKIKIWVPRETADRILAQNKSQVASRSKGVRNPI